MSPGIVIPIVLLPIVLFVVWRWYSRTVRTAPADDRPAPLVDVSAVRLTAETLHRLPTPPWRVVHEIGAQLPHLDHVIVGPPGVIAVTTRAGSRPEPARLAPTATAESTLARAALDALVAPVGVRTSLVAHVFWAAPDGDRPAAETTIDATPYVEGQRLEAWLADLAAELPDGGLEPTSVDTVWRAVVLGIGRPDPLS